MIIETAMVVNACSVVVFIAGFAKNWMLAKGNLKPVYWLNILMGLAGTALNIGVVTAMPAMWGILSFMLLNIWVVVMGIKGLMRLHTDRVKQEKITKFFKADEDLDFDLRLRPGTSFKANYREWEDTYAVFREGRCRWVDGAYACFCVTAPCKEF